MSTHGFLLFTLIGVSMQSLPEDLNQVSFKRIFPDSVSRWHRRWNSGQGGEQPDQFHSHTQWLGRGSTSAWLDLQRCLCRPKGWSKGEPRLWRSPWRRRSRTAALPLWWSTSPLTRPTRTWPPFRYSACYSLPLDPSCSSSTVDTWHSVNYSHLRPTYWPILVFQADIGQGAAIARTKRKGDYEGEQISPNYSQCLKKQISCVVLSCVK